MAIVVVGGHTRNIGKTSVMEGLLRGLAAGEPVVRAVAMKITQFGHGVCSANGEPCDCVTAEHALAVTEERERASGTDSSRYLAAGAVRSLWVRTRVGDLAEAMPRVRQEIAAAEHVLIESNSVLRFVRPDVLVMVLDAGVRDFKDSTRRYLDRADAVVVTGGTLTSAAWEGVSPALVRRAHVFAGRAGEYCPEELVEWVRERMVMAAVTRRSA